MKKYSLILLLFYSSLASADYWTQKANFPGGGRELPFSFAAGNYGYAGGGAGFQDLYQYDPVANSWTLMAGIPGTGRRASSGFAIGSKGYVTLGHDAIWHQDLWEYDPVLNSWTQKADFGGGQRAFASAFVIGNKAYVGTGTSGSVHFNDLWEWDPATNIWVAKTNLPGPARAGAVGFAVSGKGYISTGTLFPTWSNNLNDLWEYDPVNNSWLQKADLPALARVDATGFGMCDRGFVATGGETPMGDLWEFNPVLNQWTQKTDFGGPQRDDATSFVLGQKAYLGLGQNLTGLPDDFWEYSPDCSILPVAIFTAPHPVCPGTCIAFTNLSQNATSFQWSFPGASPGTSTDVSPVNICYPTPGTYDVTLIATNVTGSDTLTLTNYITVYPYSPSQSILQSGDTLFSNTGFVSYQWFYLGDSINGATNYYYLATQSGDYSVVCIDNNGCSVEAVVLNVIAEVPFTVYGFLLTVYPNPAYDFILINNLPSGTRQEVMIYDILGGKMPVIMNPNVNIQSGKIDISNLASGIYYLVMRIENKTICTKFLKQ